MMKTNAHLTPLERAKAFFAPILDETSCGDEEDDQELVDGCATMIVEAVKEALTAERRRVREGRGILPLSPEWVRSVLETIPGMTAEEVEDHEKVARGFLAALEIESPESALLGKMKEVLLLLRETLEEDRRKLDEDRDLAVSDALTAERRQAMAVWSDDDREDQWTPTINRAHPMRSGSHDAYQTAMEMVGHRHSKGALVALVNWLLVRAAPCGCGTHDATCPLVVGVAGEDR